MFTQYLCGMGIRTAVAARTFQRDRCTHFATTLMVESRAQFLIMDFQEGGLVHAPVAFFSSALFRHIRCRRGIRGACIKSILDPSMLAVYETVAARVSNVCHALGLFVVAWVWRETEHPLAVKAGWLLCTGIVCSVEVCMSRRTGRDQVDGGVDSVGRGLVYQADGSASRLPPGEAVAISDADVVVIPVPFLLRR